MAYARTRNICGSLLICGLLLVGCTEGGSGGDDPADRAVPGESAGASRSGGDAKAGADASAESGALPAASPTVETDPAKQPRTADQARALIGKVIAGPELFGSAVVRTTPYESDPSRWTLLGDGCAWQLEELPADVLATLTRHFEVPAGDGKGAVRLSATVTVHRTVLDAAWEQAGMLEESLGCKEQLLRPGERLTELTSTAYSWGEGNNNYSDDSLMETGVCVSDSRGGPYPYMWYQATLGPVVVSASACGGRGRDGNELQTLVQGALPRMLVRAKSEIGRPVGSGSASPEPDTSPSDSASTPGPKSDPKSDPASDPESDPESGTKGGA